MDAVLKHLMLIAQESMAWFVADKAGAKRVFHPIGSDLAEQSPGADPQQLGGPLSVAPGSEQAVLNRLPLEFGKSDTRTVPDRSAIGVGNPGVRDQVVRKKGRKENRSTGTQQGLLEHTLQLTNVPGPGVVAEPLHRLGVDIPDFPTEFATESAQE